jgi:crossover junction endodeoxyribonuclease RusA
MTRRLSFDVSGVAQPKGSMRTFLTAGSRRPMVTSDNPKARTWQDAVHYSARLLEAERFLGPVLLDATFYLPRPKSLKLTTRHHTRKPDLDKLIRCIADALTGVLYIDDSQVVSVTARKRYVLGNDPPHAIIVLAEVTEE